MKAFSISGYIVDVIERNIFAGKVHINKGHIQRIECLSAKQVSLPHNKKSIVTDLPDGPYILPGLIDAHVHIESSMLVPSAFARLATIHGTVGTVSDPHEIANVLGMQGVRFMIDSGKRVPFHFNFGAPSCVPATSFESTGAAITANDVRELLRMDEVKYLSEMMNYPGVIYDNQEVTKKIEYARAAGKAIDGHAPGLGGEPLKKYVSKGISTDHECTSIEEAREKLSLGMKILIRECTPAQNFDTLIDLLRTNPDDVMLCTDDSNPTELIHGHINLLVKRALAKGHDLFDVLRAATLNPKKHYGLENGLLREGDSADLIVVDNLADFNVLQTFVKGIKAAQNGQSLIAPVPEETPNRFYCRPVSPAAFSLPASGSEIRVIEAIDGQLITRSGRTKARIESGFAVSDIDNDLLKIVVINRYKDAPPAIAFVKNFGLKRGAIASTVAHDSHNIIAIGTNDADLAGAVNLLVKHQGGYALHDGSDEDILPLPVAGLMTNADGFEVAAKFEALRQKARQQLGSTLKSPFMTLSFMALLVISELKLSDKGLFDGKKFVFTSLFV
jgi:adenine deaminase